jgi:hypothetical protein
VEETIIPNHPESVIKVLDEAMPQLVMADAKVEEVYSLLEPTSICGRFVVLHIR